MKPFEIVHPFHLAFPVTDLEAARRFYRDLLGATEGRSSPAWVDFNFFGHQITAHLQSEYGPSEPCNWVDGEAIPVRHFGVILDWQTWLDLAEDLQRQQIPFIIKPHIRFAGQVGEQATLFIRDPSGNVLEFKSFRSADHIFAR